MYVDRNHIRLLLLPLIAALFLCLFVTGCCNYCAEGIGDQIELEIRDATTGTNLIDSLDLQADDLSLVSDLPGSKRYYIWDEEGYFQIETPSVLERDKLDDRLTVLVNGSVVEVLLIYYNDGGEDSCCDYVSPLVDSLDALGNTQLMRDERWRVVVFL